MHLGIPSLTARSRTGNLSRVLWADSRVLWTAYQQTESDLDKNDRDRAKVRSFAMRKRVAEMQLQPPRFAALKQHCIDVIAGLQAGMYPPYAIDNAAPYAIDNADGIVSPSGTDAFQTTVNRKLLKLRKRYYNNRHSWTWTDQSCMRTADSSQSRQRSFHRGTDS